MPSVYEYKDTALTLLKQLDFKIPLVVPKKATVTWGRIRLEQDKNQ